MIPLLAGGIIVACALALAGCFAARGNGPSPEELRRLVVEAAGPLRLSPFGAGSTDPTPVKVKADPTYYVLTGIAAAPPDDVRGQLLDALRAQGWHVVRSGPVDDYFLGWEAIATRDSAVLFASVGDRAVGAPDSPYQPIPGRSYVQLAIAGRDSGPDWSHVGS
jgi:hypothetical protein